MCAAIDTAEFGVCVIDIAPNQVYVFVPGTGMLGPFPKEGCHQLAKATRAAVHATATAIGNLKGNGTKLMTSLKATAPWRL